MKIAILTQPLHTNYGGILQAYALQTFLVNNGNQVTIINRDSEKIISLRLLLLRFCSVFKCFIRVVFLGKKEYVIMNPLSPFYHTIWSGYDVLPFVKRNIKQSKVIRSSKYLRSYLKRNRFDCIIVGSDQVWRPCYSPCITDFFLKGMPNNIVKLAYAASFGTDKWEFTKEQTQECAALVKLFDGVSVREVSAVQLCKKYLEINAEHLLDPTMLLDKEDYIKLFNHIEHPNRGDLFCYILDESSDASCIVESLCQEGYEPNYASVKTFPSENNPRPYQLSVEEWLYGIYHAKLVVTDSFHACVFSILFNRPFIVLGNKNRGNARFDSLLAEFNLQERMVDSYQLYIKKKNRLLELNDIYGTIELLRSKRQNALLFLKHFGLLKSSNNL